MTCQLTPIEKLLVRSASALYGAIGHDLCTDDIEWSADDLASVLQDRMYDWLIEEEGISTGLPAAWAELAYDRKRLICIAAL